MLFLGAMFARARFIEIFFCWNVLIGAPGRRLYRKIINPSKMLDCVKFFLASVLANLAPSESYS